MNEVILIENLLVSIFEYLGIKIDAYPSDRAKIDFIIVYEDKRIALEIKNSTNRHVMQHVINQFNEINKIENIDRFILITVNKEQINTLHPIHNINIDSYSIEEFISEFLKIEIKYIQKSNPKLSNLLYTLQFTINNLDKSNAPIEDRKQILQNKLDSGDNNKQEYKGLKGHLSKAVINNLIETDFAFGKLINFSNNNAEEVIYNNVHCSTVIIYTDIKNYSTLVSVSNETEFYNIMNRYYNYVNKNVLDKNGFFYKFVGDAAVFFFNFPNNISINTNLKLVYANALLCSIEIIKFGKTFFEDFQEKKDNNVSTGTRVGIAYGAITPMVVGDFEDFKMEFLGDKINLSARLQKESENDGILISNEFYHKLIEIDNRFNILSSYKTKVEAKDVKGQLSDIIAYQIPADAIIGNELMELLNSIMKEG